MLVRRRVAFQWFFTEFSVRPGRCLAMSAHLQETSALVLPVPREERQMVPGCAVQMQASSNGPETRFDWACRLDRTCLATQPKVLLARVPT